MSMFRTRLVRFAVGGGGLRRAFSGHMCQGRHDLFLDRGDTCRETRGRDLTLRMAVLADLFGRHGRTMRWGVLAAIQGSERAADDGFGWCSVRRARLGRKRGTSGGPGGDRLSGRNAWSLEI